jgi:hypothetical protein
MGPSRGKGDEDVLADGKGGRRGDDRRRGYDFRYQLAADAAEILLVEEVGFAILAERQHQGPAAVRGREG